ncbi:MAG: hypothetical protein GXX95_00255 [Methanomassiliicoccus sp.]|nr:hypothetical protein [Methanomassiliicoccus sp.]
MDRRPNSARPRKRRRNPGHFGLPVTPQGCRFAVEETVAAGGRFGYDGPSPGPPSDRGG